MNSCRAGHAGHLRLIPSPHTVKCAIGKLSPLVPPRRNLFLHRKNIHSPGLPVQPICSQGSPTGHRTNTRGKTIRDCRLGAATGSFTHGVEDARKRRYFFHPLEYDQASLYPTMAQTPPTPYTAHAAHSAQTRSRRLATAILGTFDSGPRRHGQPHGLYPLQPNQTRPRRMPASMVPLNVSSLG